MCVGWGLSLCHILYLAQVQALPGWFPFVFFLTTFIEPQGSLRTNECKDSQTWLCFPIHVANIMKNADSAWAPSQTESIRTSERETWANQAWPTLVQLYWKQNSIIQISNKWSWLSRKRGIFNGDLSRSILCVNPTGPQSTQVFG